ncbi:glycosyltransferase family 4 protein [Clostridium butyricum]|uniref:glycosyltransferase family 4 protein n=1 Tax=Clostridium butyricum TaxID=1492 RepID=UPI0013D12954|nr:glycosyltransferase family 4 protein [Clostridium butyricum]MCQ2023708.1 glycosyltransferase family 4 protein [Clostridium butyricum]NFB70094.1 glycosyltransferase family 1 protein [Clostridium butyricum]NFB89881.1 glycosyltransferase family 1 protein [Clostridium butyricum]
MNILHITTYLQGGAGRIINDLAISQKTNGNNVIVVINDREEIGYENYSEYINKLKENNINVYRIDSTFKRDIYLNTNAANILNKIIVENNIDLIHAHAAVPSMVSMMAKSNIKKYIPVIQTMHGWGTNKNELHEKMDVSILNMVEKVVCVSNADKALLINKGVNKSKIITIYNGIKENIDENLYNTEIIKAIKEFKENEKLLIGCIGSVCERKNQRLIIEALKFVENDDLKVVFLGEGNLINELIKISTSHNILNKIEFLGYVDRAYAYLKYFDYVILPSLSEGLPLTILEAYRDGIPVLVSDIDCLKEIVEDNKNGFIFNKNNEKELAKLIDKIFELKKSEKYFELKNNNKDNFLKNFTIDKMYNSYIEIYKDV